MNSRVRNLTISTITILLVSAAWLGAGPLNPPAGSVSPSYKTLSEIEPRIAVNAANTPPGVDSLFKITQPGSYYLTGNIVGVAAKHGIDISVSGVTLDLNGFDVVGVPGSLDGVFGSNAPTVNITVRNGSVRNWGGNGVNVFNAGSNTIVEGITAYQNGGVGVFGGFGGIVTRCTAYANGGNGIHAGSATTVIGCSAFTNTGSGIAVGAGSTVMQCATRFNTVDGIVAFRGCLIKDNTCASNGVNAGNGAGIHVTDVDNRIEGNNCTQADRGIDVDVGGNIIIGNTCSGNTTDWDIAANNIYGPIIDRRIPGTVVSTPAVTGFNAASTLGSTDPSANYSY
ncbi:MAG: right-handed parallel beta-helix repeat-containing protein [Phycisphaerales bacterium]